VRRNLLKAEDFAVVIKNLPSKQKYKELNDLKAQLWNHIENTVA